MKLKFEIWGNAGGTCSIGFQICKIGVWLWSGYTKGKGGSSKIVTVAILIRVYLGRNIRTLQYNSTSSSWSPMTVQTLDSGIEHERLLRHSGKDICGSMPSKAKYVAPRQCDGN